MERARLFVQDSLGEKKYDSSIDPTLYIGLVQERTEPSVVHFFRIDCVIALEDAGNIDAHIGTVDDVVVDPRVVGNLLQILILRARVHLEGLQHSLLQDILTIVSQVEAVRIGFALDRHKLLPHSLFDIVVNHFQSHL